MADISVLRSLTKLTNLALNRNQIIDLSALKTLTHLQKLALAQNTIDHPTCPVESE
ncbi:MAG: hypothetical protein H7Z11_21600 [Verrucomicrobia bacterium]|nr:hypothetical protein [Leptolyngbya sp. ES-bin-22]